MNASVSASRINEAPTLNVAGTSVVITGAGAGIGRALALGAARRRARVAVIDIDPVRANSIAGEIAAGGGIAIGFGCDVAVDADVRNLAKRVEAEFGEVNVLFNNAGVYVNAPLEKTNAADAAWMLSVNVLGIIHGTQAFLPMLHAARVAGKPAHIVNTGSENSFGVPTAGPHTVYTATKHAVLGLSDALRRDLEGSGIGISVLCPGVVVTDLFDSRRNRPSSFGGPRQAKPEHVQIARQKMSEYGQTPERCAELCFAGLERGEFLIVADPTIREVEARRHADVVCALDRLDETLAQHR